MGAKNLVGDQLGQGGPGGYSIPGIGGCCFTQNENNQITAINNEFANSISTRGEPNGFAAWGGALTFDNDASTNWHLNYTTAVPAGKSDLFSVAFHEIGHVLGLRHSSNANSVMYGFSLDGQEWLDLADLAALATRHKLRIETAERPVKLTQP